MAERCATSFIYLLAFGGFAAAAETTKSYLEIGLDNEAICNPSTDKIQSVDVLRKMKDSAIIVKPSHTFDTWMVRYSKHCRFKIKTVKDAGLFAVIQKMSLRRNGTECLDYIRFTAENFDQKEASVSEKYCGKLYNHNGLKRYHPYNDAKEYDIQSADEDDSSEHLGRMFEISSTAGKITTEIYISKEPLRPGDILDLLIVYTPFTECEPTTSSGLKLFRWMKHPQFKNACINDQFSCDFFTNCVSGMCSDESNCTRNIYPNEIISDETGTKVTVSAVTTIILCFIIFILCMWICRKHKKLCWSPDCAGPASTVSGTTTGLPMERGQQNAPNPPLVASAPMLEVAVPTSLQDKDLPPSYDSLFPNQLNTNTATANT